MLLMPDARPSKPSIKFIALIIATINIIDKIIFIHVGNTKFKPKRVILEKIICHIPQQL